MVDLGKYKNELYIIVYFITIYWDLIYIGRISNVYSCKYILSRSFCISFYTWHLFKIKKHLGKNQKFFACLKTYIHLMEKCFISSNPWVPRKYTIQSRYEFHEVSSQKPQNVDNYLPRAGMVVDQYFYWKN